MWVYRAAKDAPTEIIKRGFIPWLEKQGRWNSGKAAELIKNYLIGQDKSPMDFLPIHYKQHKGRYCIHLQEQALCWTGHTKGREYI